MPPVADDALPHTADFHLSSVEFFTLRSPARAFQGFAPPHHHHNDRRPAPAAPHDEARAHNNITPVHLRPDKLPRGRAPRRRKPDAGSAERRPASTTTNTPTSNRSPQPRPDPPPSTLASVRSELELTRADLARAHADAAKLADRCKALDRALNDAADAARAREKDLDGLARERDQLRQDRDQLAQDRDRLAQDRDQLRKDMDQLLAERQARAQAPDRALPPLRPDARQSDHAAARRDAPFDLDDKRHVRTRSPFPSRRHKSTPPTQRPLSGIIDPSPPPSSSTLSSSSSASHALSSTKPNDPFLTKTDSWSGAEVIVAVQDLNSEILQLAAAATELIPATEKRTKPPPPPSPPAAAAARLAHAHAAKDTAARLGQPFARLLATRDHAQDSVLIQVALQACAAAHAARLLAMFCVGLPAPTNALFCQLHAHMHTTEPQATSSRWRALASSHLRQLYPALEEDTVGEFIEAVARSFADVFLLCGYAPGESPSPSSSPNLNPNTNTNTNPSPSPSPSQSTGTSSTGHPASADALKRQFATQMRRIAHAACRLARVTTEEIMSTSFDVVLIEPARAFDAAAMANAFAGLGGGAGAGAGAGRGQVLCTTELGLRCATRKHALALLGGSEGGGGDADGMERTMLLKPKVVLDTVAQVLEHSAEPAA